MIKKNRFSLISIYLTFFVDNLGWAIVFPIFAPYFIDPNNVLFSPDVLLGTRTMILGFFLMAFSLGQFFGAPLIGEYADKHGRKKALAVTVFFTLIGMALSAWSMSRYDLNWLFVGRLITGVFAGNTSVCLSCISDLSEDEKIKIKRFGYLSTIAGLAFVLGAFAGGKMADKSINSSFSASVPLWLAAALSLVNFVFVLVGFKETSVIQPDVRFHFFEAFDRIKTALQTKKIKGIYTVYFLFIIAWTILFQFFPVFAVEKFAFTSSAIGDLALFVGVCWAIGSGYLNKLLIQRFPAVRILEMCLLGFTVMCALVIVPTNLAEVLAVIGLLVLLGGVAWPLCTGLISSSAPAEMQGKILGVSQSIQSFGMAIGPLIGGLAYQYSSSLTFLVAAAMGFIAVIVYILFLRKNGS
jgi:DHA1 family tetracycline resistance protein-like MFS transporter